MSSSGRLYRNFIILQEDERGYANSTDKTVSGYSKIEAKGDNCKISFYAQNLRKDNEKYHMMLICCKKDAKQVIDLGPMSISNSGKAEETKEYNISNIGLLDVPYDKISGAAICNYKDGVPVYVMCGFLNGEKCPENWKNYSIMKAKDYKENKMDKPQFKKEEKKPCKDNEKEKSKEHKKDSKKSSKGKECKKDRDEDQEVEQIVENVDNEQEPVKEERVKIENKSIEKEESVEASRPISKEDEIKDTLNKYISREYVANENKENLRGKFDEYEAEIKKEAEFNPSSCKIKGSIGEYFESIAEGFEQYKDGIKDIKYCKWYKVPIHDLYEMCNMSNYNKYTLAYYPMLNYYPYIKRYGYFMLGYKCDGEGNLKYIVYGVPGKKDKDDQPYDGKTGFVTWTTLGNKKDTGMWLMFYDYKNSTVVVPMK